MLLLPAASFASDTQGTIDATNKYAWGENIGWLNFGCDGCGVEITDAGLTGYAWSAQYGWINLNPTNGGVDNDGEGTLSGYAWGSTLGWINFTGVTIGTTGEFSGYATLEADSSQINFNCANGSSCASADFKVATDWRPASSRASGSGGGASGSRPKPWTPPGPPPWVPVVPPPFSPVAVAPVGLSANIFNAVSEFVSGLFRPYDWTPLAEVPDEPPVALGASWNLLPVRAINAFVFAPMPYEIRLLASKFPELDRTFKEVGIERFTDVTKLAGTSLNTPGLTDILSTSLQDLTVRELAELRAIGGVELDPSTPALTAILNKTVKNLTTEEIAELQNLSGVALDLPGFSQSETPRPGVGVGRIALVEGLPLSQFSLATKNQLPSEFVFARGAGELVDYNVALSVGEQGDVTQRISSLPGKTVKLVVKPVSRARSVTGYIVFLSSAPKVSTKENQNPILRSSLTASALFAMDDFVEQASEIPVEKKLVLSTFEYEDPDRDGIYTAEVTTPVVPGEYEIITVIDYVDPELGARKMSMVTVIDPEGYVYEESGGKETRVPNAIVSLYKLNSATRSYELWNANDYQQENPQITDVRGTYSFLVPQGTYYFEVVAPGYKTFEGKAFAVREGNGIHENIELKPNAIRLAGVDWQTVLLVVVLILLVYNLYRNSVQSKLSKLAELLKKNDKQ